MTEAHEWNYLLESALYGDTTCKKCGLGKRIFLNGITMFWLNEKIVKIGDQSETSCKEVQFRNILR